MVATPPSSTPSINSSCVIPISSIDIWQATNLTPFCCALWISSSSEETPFFFMTARIILAPMPPKFIRESPSFLEPRGNIKLNIFPMSDFLMRTFSGLRKMLTPQNVKNIVTGRPIAAAPLAMMNEAIALSKSPLNTTKVLPCSNALLSGRGNSFFTMVA